MKVSPSATIGIIGEADTIIVNCQFSIVNWKTDCHIGDIQFSQFINIYYSRFLRVSQLFFPGGTN